MNELKIVKRIQVVIVQQETGIFNAHVDITRKYSEFPKATNQVYTKANLNSFEILDYVKEVIINA